MDYPQYYRKAGRCLKVTSPTEANEITLPPESPVAFRSKTTFPNAERQLEETGKMEVADDGTWRDFLFTFYKSVRKEHEEVSLNQL